MDDSMSMTTNADTGLWTDAPSYVATLSIFFDALWSLAPDAESVIESIKTGEPMQEIRTFTTQEEYASIFRNMITKAMKSIDIIARNATMLPVPLSRLEEVAGRVITVRLLTRTDEETLPEVSKIADTSIVVFENAAVTDLVFLAIDGKEVLLNVPHAESQKRTIWSNMSAYVGTMMLVFKDYWELGKPLQEKLRLAAQRQRVELLSNRIRKGFEGVGWVVETSAVVVGTSSKNYNFDVVAKNPDNADIRLCIDIVVNEPVYNKIIEKSNVVPDLATSSYLIASLMPFKTEELRLAELYRIRIIYSDTEEGLVSSLIKLVQR
jgi:hypothetical protein